jgi:hypothetical protein
VNSKDATHAEANAYLEAEYLPEHNRRFARAASQGEDYHRRAPGAAELDKVFRLETPRTVSDDWVVGYDNWFFSLEPQSHHYAPSQGQVMVCDGRNGSLAAEFRQHGLKVTACRPRTKTAPPSKPVSARKPRAEATHNWMKNFHLHKSPPWRAILAPERADVRRDTG